MPEDSHNLGLISQDVAEPSTASARPSNDSVPPGTETAKPDRQWGSWERVKLLGTQAIAVTTALSTLLVAGSFFF